MDQPPSPPLLVSSNDDNNNNNNVEIVGSITNGYDYYSNGLLQQGDTHQQNPCSCNNCLSAAGSFQLPYDNDNNYMDISESSSPMQHHMIEQSSPISQKEHQHINDQQFIDHIQPQPAQDFSFTDNNTTIHSDSSNTNINSQSSYTELFRIEISGVEIIFRKKFLLNLNHNLSNLSTQQPQNEKPLGNRPGRIQNRVHPYLMPECRYNKINYRNPINSVPKQYYTHLSPMTPQLNQQIIDSYQ